MEAYYRNLLAGQGRATALREAMRALRQTQPHPHYWAPFIALGRDAPLRALQFPQPEPVKQCHSPGLLLLVAHAPLDDAGVVAVHLGATLQPAERPVGVGRGRVVTDGGIYKK